MWLMALRIALRALRRNKLRSFLTMLGIIIGVGAVIAMVAIGEGAKKRVQEQIASLGTNLLVVLPGTMTLGGARTGSGGVQTLVGTDARAIMQEIPVVSQASPSLRQVLQVIASDQNWSTVVQGVAPEFQQIRNWQVEQGRFLSEADVDSTAKVALIGRTVAYNLFGSESPIDAIIRIKKIPFRIIGVLGPKGQTGHGTDQDDVVMIPYSTMQKRIMGITYVQQIVVSAVSADKTQEATEQISALLRQRHRIQPGRDDDFNVRNLSDIAEAASNSATVMAILLGSIASVSLLVGGIGIMSFRQHRLGLSPGRRHRHYEYHACFSHGENPRDRDSHGRRGTEPRYHASIPCRGRRDGGQRRDHRHFVRHRELASFETPGSIAHVDQAGHCRRCLSLLRRRGYLFRFLSGKKGRQPGSDRCVKIRIRLGGLQLQAAPEAWIPARSLRVPKPFFLLADNQTGE